jgi:hypothetical protein
MESSGRAELWQRCTALEQELQSLQDNLEVATRSLERAEQQLGECCAAPLQRLCNECSGLTDKFAEASHHTAALD